MTRVALNAQKASRKMYKQQAVCALIAGAHVYEPGTECKKSWHAHLERCVYDHRMRAYTHATHCTDQRVMHRVG